MTDATHQAGSTTILFTDIERSTELVEALGDRGWLELLRSHNAIVREQVEAHRGFEVKAVGDGFMVAFTSPALALGCAVGVQRALARRAEQAEGPALSVRIGLHAGTVVTLDDDYFGRDVIIASRLCGQAAGGEILVSDVLRRAVGDAALVPFSAPRPLALKGLSGKVTAHTVVWDPTGAAVAAARPRRPAAAEPATLLDRDWALSMLGRALRGARSRRGGAVLVTGPAGIGKTVLLDAVAALARDSGVPVMRAGASRLERGFGFGVARQLLEPTLRRLPAPARAKLLSDGAEAAARPLGFGDGDGASDAWAAHAGLTRLVANLAKREPLALLVDDVQWADPESAAWLAFLAPRLAELPVLSVIAQRTGEEPVPAEALADLARAERVHALDLEPLGEASTGELVRQLAPAASERFIAACLEATGGNPFALRELLAAAEEAAIVPDDAGAQRLVEISPTALSRLVLGRLRALPREAQGLADAVAVLDAEADLRLASELAGIAAAEGVHAADALCRAGILRARRPLQFEHPLIHTVIERNVPVGTRSSLHGRAARLLREAGAEPQVVGLHLAASEPARDPDAVAWLREAAADALAGGAPGAAADFLDRALKEPPPREQRAELVEQAGRAALRAGRVDAAARLLRRALRDQDDPVARADVALAHARAVIEQLELTSAEGEAEAHRLLDGLAAVVEPLGSDQRALRFALEAQALDVRNAIWTMRSRPPDPDEDALMDRLAAEATSATTGERDIIAMVAASRGTRGIVPAQQLCDDARRALGDGSVMRELADGSSGDTAVELLIMCEQLAEAERHLAAADRHARRTGARVAAPMIAALRAVCATQSGRLDDAAEHLGTVWDAATTRPLGDYGRSVAHGAACALRLARGDLDAAAAAVEEIDSVRLRHHAAGLVALARGDYERAVAELEPAQAMLERRGMWRTAHPLLPLRPDLALALVALGHRDRAEALARAELEVAERVGLPGCIAAALRALAAARPPDERAALLERARVAGAGSEVAAAIVAAHG